MARGSGKDAVAAQANTTASTSPDTDATANPTQIFTRAVVVEVLYDLSVFPEEDLEEMKALIFVHQGGETMVNQRIDRYHLPNTVGNLAERALTFASLVFGGVMDRFPDLKICLAHGGGTVCYGIGRMDRGWQVRPEARTKLQNPPSTYVRRFYYDCLTHSEAALRFLLDTVGADRVVLGTDWPADMSIDWPVSWIQSLESLTQQEKDLILWKNLERILGV